MNSYEWQRWICRQAKEHGWKGEEPSVLGTHAADTTILEVRAFLRALPESCHALMWCAYMKANAPENRYEFIDACGEQQEAINAQGDEWIA